MTATTVLLLLPPLPPPLPPLPPMPPHLPPHLPRIEGFHRRYMASNRAIKAWRETLGERPVELLAPQHGPVYRGAAVGQFLGWLEGLECGVDLLQPGGVFRR